MKIQTAPFAALALAVFSPLAAYAQATESASQATATPTVPSLNRAPAADQINYSIGASESLLWGYNSTGTASSTAVNGSAAYVSGNQSHPISFLYSGGYLFSDNSSSRSGSYQNLGVSQQILTRHLGIVVGDTVSYLPNAPVFGLSGIPGVGDVGTQPIGTGGLPVNSILTNYGRRINNTASGSVTTNISDPTSLNIFAAYTVQRFLDETGIDNNELDAGASIDHRIDARNTFGAGYVYTRFTYLRNTALNFGLTDLRIDSHEGNAQYEHVFTRRLTFNIAAGPQFTESSRPDIIPSRVDFAVNAALSMLARRTQYILAYTRGTSAGSGVLIGTISDNVNFTADHEFTPRWHGAFSSDYGHSSSLVSYANGARTNAKTFYAGVQLTRQLGRFFNAYGSYNLEYQDLSGPLLAFNGLSAPANAFSGTANIVGFGINYSPRPIHLHRH